MGTDEDTLITILCTLDEEDIFPLQTAYADRYERSLEQAGPWSVHTNNTCSRSIQGLTREGNTWLFIGCGRVKTDEFKGDAQLWWCE